MPAKRAVSLLFLGAVVLVLAACTESRQAQQGANDITICHATASESNPFNRISVAKDGAVSGHDGHPNDIIPPFDYLDNDGVSQHYPGKNWGAAGQAIYNNECEPLRPTTTTARATTTVPIVVPTQVVPTTVPTTVPIVAPTQVVPSTLAPVAPTQVLPTTSPIVAPTAVVPTTEAATTTSPSASTTGPSGTTTPTTGGGGVVSPTSVAPGSTQPGGSGTDPGGTSVASTDPSTPPVTGTESVSLLVLAAVLVGLGCLALLGAARPRRS